MKSIRIACTTFMIFSIQYLATAADKPNRSAELQVLERFIGTWETIVNIETTGQKYNSIEKRRWSDRGTFLLSEDLNLVTMKESLFLITYDPKGEKYQCCIFDGNTASILHGIWDEKTQTMKWSGVDAAGNKSTGKTLFIDKDHNEWSMVVTDPGGKVLWKGAGKQVRSKK
jgi:hypothetical protein